MSSIMLIDARHSEETRVGVMTQNKLAEFDYETASKTQIKGNVYLAKVTRVEPSLQAAFVEYGGNRQGFLAFSEIHPDYYQIPAEDREALLAEEAELVKKEQAEEEPEPKKKPAKKKKGEAEDEPEEIDPKDAREAKNTDSDGIVDEQLLNKRRVRALKRRYKIQEVIKKRQVLLVQAVKEERGGKGAAMTTYLSLPGRYCVLMPNTTHGNGISRKIGDAKERQRLRKIIETFTVPAGMGCIIRTVGMGRTKPEIKRDLDYLFKAWAEIRELTLKSTAPTLIFEEGSLIKRALRDLYDKHISEILVEGKEGHKLAQTFMKGLMPTHAKKVKLYEGKTPLFHKYGMEKEIDGLFTPVVTLPSGGYLVINPTEALIAIDVNSGKATKEHNIEETALQTNIEAAVEIARQLRLRDIAGLIVIDFIDMEYMGNVRTIERRFRDALKGDRARIFTNRISALGLLEMSRQRLRASLYEISTEPCPHCEASGRIPSMSTLSLRLMRQVEDIGIEGRFPHVLIQAPQELSLFLLNAKRKLLDDIEKRYDIKITVTPNPRFRMPHFNIEGLTEVRMAAELAKDETLASYVLGDEATTSEPVGFGKSDGRGSFPGKKRRRGSRGGSRHRPARHQNSQGKDQHKPAQNGAPSGTAKPEDKDQKPHQDSKVKSEASTISEKSASAKAKPEKQVAKADKPKPSRGRKPAPKKDKVDAKPVTPVKPADKKQPAKKAPAKAKPAEKAAPKKTAGKSAKAPTEKPAKPVKKESTGPKKRGWWSKK